MSDASALVPRRSLLATSMLSLAAVAGPRPALAATETPNAALARRFCAAWAEAKADPTRLVDDFMTADCIVRVMDSSTETRGRRAAIAMFHGWLEGRRRFTLEILETVELASVVVQRRIDTTFSPGAAPHEDRIVSVFVMSQGRIKEWCDYFV